MWGDTRQLRNDLKYLIHRTDNKSSARVNDKLGFHTLHGTIGDPKTVVRVHINIVDFEINGKKYKLDKQQASYGTSFGRCVLSIMGQRGLPMHAWVLGDAFMQGVSVVFDMGRNRMGFAPSA